MSVKRRLHAIRSRILVCHTQISCLALSDELVNVEFVVEGYTIVMLVTIQDMVSEQPKTRWLLITSRPDLAKQCNRFALHCGFYDVPYSHVFGTGKRRETLDAVYDTMHKSH